MLQTNVAKIYFRKASDFICNMPNYNHFNIYVGYITYNKVEILTLKTYILKGKALVPLSLRTQNDNETVLIFVF